MGADGLPVCLSTLGREDLDALYQYSDAANAEIAAQILIATNNCFTTDYSSPASGRTVGRHQGAISYSVFVVARCSFHDLLIRWPLSSNITH